MDIGPLENDTREVVMGNKEMVENKNTFFFVRLHSGRHQQHYRKSRESGGKSGVAITKVKVCGKLKGLKVDVT